MYEGSPSVLEAVPYKMLANLWYLIFFIVWKNITIRSRICLKKGLEKGETIVSYGFNLNIVQSNLEVDPGKVCHDSISWTSTSSFLKIWLNEYTIVFSHKFIIDIALLRKTELHETYWDLFDKFASIQETTLPAVYIIIVFLSAVITFVD